MSGTARDRFNIGDRVRLSPRGLELRLVGGREIGPVYGTVCGFSKRPDLVLVRPDGYKTVDAYHVEFWEREAVRSRVSTQRVAVGDRVTPQLLDVVEAMQAKLDAALARNAELLNMLRSLEWSGFDDYDGVAACPICTAIVFGEQHKPDCELAALLEAKV